MDSVVLRSRGTAVAGVVALVLAADQVSKSAVVAANPHGTGSGLVTVRLVHNTGAAVGGLRAGPGTGVAGGAWDGLRGCQRATLAPAG